MASPLSPGVVVRCTAVCVNGSQTALPSVHFMVLSAGAPPATDLDLAQAVDTAWQAQIKAMMSTRSTYNGVQAKILGGSLIARQAVGFISSAGAGTTGSTDLPQQTAGLSSLRTATPGRKGRGRVYWPFPSQSFVGANGQPTNPYISLITAINTALLAIAGISVGGRTATVVWVVTNKALTTNFPILQTISETGFATCRRRGAFGRPNAPPI